MINHGGVSLPRRSPEGVADEEFLYHLDNVGLKDRSIYTLDKEKPEGSWNKTDEMEEAVCSYFMQAS